MATTGIRKEVTMRKRVPIMVTRHIVTIMKTRIQRRRMEPTTRTSPSEYVVEKGVTILT
jgi:hypothetical protein